jgi:hypothetical protein
MAAIGCEGAHRRAAPAPADGDAAIPTSPTRPTRAEGPALLSATVWPPTEELSHLGQ